jgi:hypothetical protein
MWKISQITTATKFKDSMPSSPTEAEQLVRAINHVSQAQAGAPADSDSIGTPDSRGPTRAKRTRRAATFTSSPATAPPQLLCPTCDRPLVYRQTVISGVKPIERWDYFECRTCGQFVYRDRTRKLRRNG